MAWMACRSCSTKFAVGLLRCPQCQAVSELFAVPEEVVEAEQEADMPKISVHGGPSSALGGADEPAADAVPEAPGVAEPEPDVPQEEAVEPDEKEPETEPDTADPAEPEAPSEPSTQDAPAAPRKRAAKKTVAPSKP